MTHEDKQLKRAYILYRTIKYCRKINKSIPKENFVEMASLLRHIVIEDETFAHSICDELGIDSDLTIEQKITHIYLFGE